MREILKTINLKNIKDSIFIDLCGIFQESDMPGMLQ
jgi:hypothetical protein